MRDSSKAPTAMAISAAANSSATSLAGALRRAASRRPAPVDRHDARSLAGLLADRRLRADARRVVVAALPRVPSAGSDLRSAERHLRRAAELDPQSEAWVFGLWQLYGLAGRLLTRSSRERGPLGLVVRSHLRTFLKANPDNLAGWVMYHDFLQASAELSSQRAPGRSNALVMAEAAGKAPDSADPRPRLDPLHFSSLGRASAKIARLDPLCRRLIYEQALLHLMREAVGAGAAIPGSQRFSSTGPLSAGSFAHLRRALDLAQCRLLALHASTTVHYRCRTAGARPIALDTPRPSAGDPWAEMAALGVRWPADLSLLINRLSTDRPAPARHLHRKSYWQQRPWTGRNFGAHARDLPAQSTADVIGLQDTPSIRASLAESHIGGWQPLLPLQSEHLAQLAGTAGGGCHAQIEASDCLDLGHRAAEAEARELLQLWRQALRLGMMAVGPPHPDTTRTWPGGAPQAAEHLAELHRAASAPGAESRHFPSSTASWLASMIALIPEAGLGQSHAVFNHLTRPSASTGATRPATCHWSYGDGPMDLWDPAIQQARHSATTAVASADPPSDPSSDSLTDSSSGSSSDSDGAPSPPVESPALDADAPSACSAPGGGCSCAGRVARIWAAVVTCQLLVAVLLYAPQLCALPDPTGLQGLLRHLKRATHPAHTSTTDGGRPPLPMRLFNFLWGGFSGRGFIPLWLLRGELAEAVRAVRSSAAGTEDLVPGRWFMTLLDHVGVYFELLSRALLGSAGGWYAPVHPMDDAVPSVRRFHYQQARHLMRALVFPGRTTAENIVAWQPEDAPEPDKRPSQLLGLPPSDISRDGEASDLERGRSPSPSAPDPLFLAPEMLEGGPVTRSKRRRLLSRRLGADGQVSTAPADDHQDATSSPAAFLDFESQTQSQPLF
ncbi:hypothetical protein H696_02455 [Fonticula alba]|uniref:Uncharacterized protein n=1 Tax=Fonticula alba TaxID=691883 RepID=A0A058ZC42_FONAL|nr:hypothetical protein H696_02455 [Fonticula alba]KCV71511.1 hypothetical protein H696_02455 [Fonticula alba]|eukprot:XP_009494634.1 hypothetical protein H696_02455 [Fonticula alba]